MILVLYAICLSYSIPYLMIESEGRVCFGATYKGFENKLKSIMSDWMKTWWSPSRAFLSQVGVTLRSLWVFLWFLLQSCWCFLDSLVTVAVTDIDQLMRIMVLTGTPSAQLLVKLGSDEVTYQINATASFNSSPHLASVFPYAVWFKNIRR